MTTTKRPLDGIRVLDLSRLFPGPYATLLLSDLGAEVIKIEDKNGGDYIRHFPPHLDDGNGAAFHALNRGKKSVTLDLKSPDDKQTFLALVKTADVVVESFRPGVLEKLGLSPSELHVVNAELVVCRISGFGQDGPLSFRAGHDIGYAARAGVLGMSTTPFTPPVQVADLCGGAWPAALQIVAALYGRGNGGGGTVIDVSMTDGATAMLMMPFARHGATGEAVGAGVDLLAGSVPSYDVYATSDGHLAVGALEPKFWAAFCDVIARPDLVGEGLAVGDAGARARRDIAAVLEKKTTAEWTTMFDAADCCVEAVRTPESAFADDQARGRGLVVDVSFDAASVPLPAPPLSLVAGAVSFTKAPALGQDNDAVLAVLRR